MNAVKARRRHLGATPGSSVCHGHPDETRLVGFGTDCEDALLGCAHRFDCVADEVHQDLLDLNLVDEDVRDVMVGASKRASIDFSFAPKRPNAAALLISMAKLTVFDFAPATKSRSRRRYVRRGMAQG